MSFVSYKDSIVHFNEDLSITDHARLRSMMERLQVENADRLNAKHPDRPWWTAAVYHLRDVKSICSLLAQLDQEPVANLLADITSRTTVRLFDLVADSKEQSDTWLEELSADADELDAITEREIMRTFGQPGSVQE